MNFIRPSFEIWEQDTSSPVEDMWKHIARCTRVCYQSTSKNNGETDEEFVKRVILRNISDMKTLSCNFEKLHSSMLEHGTIYLKVPNVEWWRDLHEWEYMFYVDLSFENLTRYRQSIDAITPLVRDIKVLGEYQEA